MVTQMALHLTAGSKDMKSVSKAKNEEPRHLTLRANNMRRPEGRKCLAWSRDGKEASNGGKSHLRCHVSPPTEGVRPSPALTSCWVSGVWDA